MSSNRQNTLAVFEDFKIRRYYDEKTETWYFSVIDIIQVLIQQPDYQAARNCGRRFDSVEGGTVLVLFGCCSMLIYQL